MINSDKVKKIALLGAGVIKQIETSLPLGRIGETSDLVGAALFLASDTSSYITGHTILLEGGGLA